MERNSGWISELNLLSWRARGVVVQWSARWRDMQEDPGSIRAGCDYFFLFSFCTSLRVLYIRGE